jgi:hypothetical protein
MNTNDLAEILLICFSQLKDRDGKFVMFHRNVTPEDAVFYAKQVAELLQKELKND